MGARFTSIANAVLITYTTPILVAILAPIFLKERLERITILTLVISLAGAALIASPSVIGISRRDLMGIFWASASAITYALAAGLYLSGLRGVKAQQVGIFTYLDPVSAVVFAAIFLGEIPRLNTVLGGALIIISGVILVLVTRERVQTEVVSE